MLVTREQQQAILNQYIQENKNQDECMGFVDGINATLKLVDSIIKNNK